MWGSVIGLTGALVADMNGVLHAVDGSMIALASVVVVGGGVVFLVVGSVRHRRVERAVQRRVSISEMCRVEIGGVRGGDVEGAEAAMLEELLDVPAWLSHLLVTASASVIVAAVWFVPGSVWCDVAAAVSAVAFVGGWVRVSRGLSVARAKRDQA
jgi:hypothetical protein